MKKTLKIGLVPRGLWTATAVYAVNDTVQDATGLYASRKSGNINNPLSDSEWWVKIVDLSNVKHAADDAQAAAESAEQINQEITNAEVLRVAEENARKTEEHARKTAESGRESAEQRRLSAEAGRETAEEIREQAEGDREVSEEARQQAEQSRAANYEILSQAIQSAEVLRESAEQSRERAESDRASAENSRETAEQSRELAEVRRQTTFEQNEVSRDQQVEEKVQKLTPFAEKMNEVTDIFRDFGKYNQLPDVTLTPVYTGKRFNSKGELVTDANWNVGSLGVVVVGNTYELYLGDASKMVEGTALFVSHTIEKRGSTDVDVYNPIFNAQDTTIPASNYVCLEAMDNYEEVLVSYRADVQGANTLKVRRYGSKASIATQLSNLRKSVDLKSFADGYYQSMRVGLADNLTPRGIAQDATLTSRVVPIDVAEGNAVVQSVKGNSVVWNQQVANGNFAQWDEGRSLPNEWNNNSWVLTSRASISRLDSDSGIKIVFNTDSPSSSASVGLNYLITNNITATHKYCVSIRYRCNRAFYIGGENGTNYRVYIPISANISQYNIITSNTLFVESQFKIYWTSFLANDWCEISYLQVIDLTQMFGAGNEPTTYEEFLQRKPQVADEYAYNEGEIINNMADGVKSTDLQGNTAERLWKTTREKYFPDGLAKAGNVYDELTSTKAIKRLYSYTFTGNENIYRNVANQFYIAGVIANFSQISNNGYINSSIYTYSQNAYNNINGFIAVRGSQIWISDNRNDANLIKQELTSKTIYYELATPEEVEYDELNLSYPVTPNGREEMIAEGNSAPLSMSVAYGIDAYNSIINNKNNIGNINNLATTSKADLVSAINELKARIDAIPVATSEE